MTGTETESLIEFHENSLGFLSIEDNSIDTIITDPPYGIGFQAHGWDKALPDKQMRQHGYCLYVSEPAFCRL